MPLTKTEPFKMAIDERVESRLAKWQEGLNKVGNFSDFSSEFHSLTYSQELEEQRKATQFKATEARSLVIPPFVPKPSDKALSEISNFTLHR